MSATLSQPALTADTLDAISQALAGVGRGQPPQPWPPANARRPGEALAARLRDIDGDIGRALEHEDRMVMEVTLTVLRVALRAAAEDAERLP